jgi:hypothetical protein
MADEKPRAKRNKPDDPEAPPCVPTESQRGSLEFWALLRAFPHAHAEGYCVLVNNKHKGLTLVLKYDVRDRRLEVLVPLTRAPRVFHALHKWAFVGGVYSVLQPLTDDGPGAVRLAMEDKATVAEVVSAMQRACKAFVASADKDDNDDDDKDETGLTRQHSDAVLALLSVDGATAHSGQVRVHVLDGVAGKVEATFDVVEGWFKVECHHACTADQDFMGRLFHAVHKSFRGAGRYSVTASQAYARIFVEGVCSVAHAADAMCRVRKVFAVHINGSGGDKDDDDSGEEDSDEDSDDEDSDDEDDGEDGEEDSD